MPDDLTVMHYTTPINNIQIDFGTNSIKGSPKQRYTQQRYNVLKRGLKFIITLDEWWDIWSASGKWDDRGIRGNQYCMGRFFDKGDYTYDNVYITTNSENCSDGVKWNPTENRLAEYLPPIDKVKGYCYSKGRYVVQFRGRHIAICHNEIDARNAYLEARRLDSIKINQK